MTAAVITLGVLCAGLSGGFMWLLIDQHHTEAKDRREAEQAWAAERAQLLERIQRPERPPHSGTPALDPVELEPDDAHLVGTITYLNPDKAEGPEPAA